MKKNLPAKKRKFEDSFFFKVIAILALAMMTHVCALAQEVVVSGQVTDGEGIGMPGVNVSVKGAAIGTVTDVDGNYKLAVPSEEAVLVFSAIGFTTREASVGKQTVLGVTMNESVTELSEIVVTALGVEREEKSLGYAIQEVQGKALNQVQDPNMLNNLRGKVAGVNIVQGPTGVGSTSQITIRGESSFNNNAPLFVVDGIPIANYSVNSSSGTELSSSGVQEVDFGNGAGEISPDDIASLSVLKGAAAAALYGSRAANGVVIISTKSGKSSQKGIGVSFNTSTTFESILTLPEYQNSYGQGVNGEFAFGDGLGGGLGTNDDEDQSWGPAFNGQLIEQFDGPSTTPLGQQVLGGDVLPRAGNAITPTPWIARPDNVRDFFETGRTTTTNVAITGGGENGDFRLSYTNLDNESIVPGADLRRNSIALRTGYKLNEKLKFSTTVNYIKSESDHRPSNGYGSENHMYVFTWYGRQVDTDVLRRNIWQEGLENIQQFNYNYAWHDNPYLNSYVNVNRLDKDRILGNIAAHYQFTDDLSLTVRTGMDFANEFRPSIRAFSTQRFQNGGYLENRYRFTERNTDFLLRYRRAINSDFDFTISVGANRMDQKTWFLRMEAPNLATPGIYSFNNAAGNIAVFEENTEKRINSVYGLTQFAYRNYLFLDITARNDWSSTLPSNNWSYFYPSASVSAILSEMTTLPYPISFLKVRASAAQVGNDTDPYRLKAVFPNGTQYGSEPTATTQTSLPNTSLKPEEITEFEVGTDLRLFKGRLNIDFAYFNKTAKNQIFELPISTTSGASFKNINGGELKTTGVELMLNATAIKKVNFQWNTYFNFTKNQSTIESLPAEAGEEYVVKFSRVYGNSSRTVWVLAKEGGQLGDMYGTGFVQIDGQDLYQVAGEDENGRKIVEPVKDPNLRLLGNYNPDFTLGWGNDLQYKRFSAGFLFEWRQGGKIVSRTQAIASTSGNLITTAYRPEEGITPNGVVNTGTDENPNYVTLDNDYYMNSVRYYKAFYDRDNEANHLFDATFVKLRELRLGYDIPVGNIFNGKIQSATLSFIGRNLLLFTKDQLRTIDPNRDSYDKAVHFDPEISAIQGQSFVPGVEDMTYPSTRSYGFSFSVQF